MPRGVPGSSNAKFGMLISANVQGENKVKRLGNSMQGVQGKAKNLALSLKGLVGPLVALGAAAASLNVLRQSFDVVAERQADFATLANGLTRVSTDAPKAAKALRGVADNLGFATLFDEKAFQKGFALLTSFKNIGIDSYSRVAESAADLAQINQTDLRSSFLQLAKALSDPARGLTALARSGVIFTETQRQMILELHNSGRAMEAQAAILKIVESSYQGAARAAAEGLAGAFDTLGQKIRDFQEQLGLLLTPIILPLVKATEELVVNLTDGIKGALANIPQLIAGFKTLLKITTLWASTMVGIAAGKFFVVLLSNLKKVVAITKTLLSLEKVKLGFLKAQVALQALLASGKGGLAGIALGAGVATATYVALEKATKEMINSVEDNFTQLGENLDFSADVIGSVNKSKPSLKELNQTLTSLKDKTEEVKTTFADAFGESGKQKLETFAKSLGDIGGQMADVVIKGFKGMEDQLVQMVTTGKMSFKSLAKSIIADMARIAIRAMIIKPIMAGFGIGFAKGGVIEGGNQVTKYAKGGIVNRPTMFAMGGAGNFGIMGEAGPEAIMPLKRGRNGNLGVEASGGGTVVNVSVNAQGTAVEGDEQESKMLGKMIGAAIRSTLIQEQRPGGLLAA